MPNTVNVKYKQTGQSKNTNAHGMREMQERAFEFNHTPKNYDRAQADFVARGKPREDFYKYESVFIEVQHDLVNGNCKPIGIAKSKKKFMNYPGLPANHNIITTYSNLIKMKKTQLLFVIFITFITACQQKKTTTMTHILKNKNLEIHIDLPMANYQLARFDWTGKITAVKYKNVDVSGFEKMNVEDDTAYGKGFYNEFGIDAPIAYGETDEGGYFHKIGVGLLKKDGEPYLFSKSYNIKPADFKVTAKSDKIIIECTSQNINGYAYFLKKEIELLESGFVIKYNLRNTGEKTIATNEYNHNFLSINKDLIGSNYILSFPFRINPELFWATVNPEGKVEIGPHEISFNATPEEQFFFSNLSGGENVEAAWELINTKSKVGISEKGSFKTSKVNLWGWKHVVSPELFFDVNIGAGQAIEWSRTYTVFEIV